MIAPLADWTQPRAVLRANETLHLRVRLARVRAYWDDDEHPDLFTAAAAPLDLHARSSALLFTLESLTAFLEWVTDAMEGEEFKPAASPALETLLAFHAGLAHTGRMSSPVVS